MCLQQDNKSCPDLGVLSPLSTSLSLQWTLVSHEAWWIRTQDILAHVDQLVVLPSAVSCPQSLWCMLVKIGSLRTKGLILFNLVSDLSLHYFKKKIWVYNCVLLSKERSHLFPYTTQSFCLRFGSRHANITILYCSTTNRWTWLTNDALLWDPRGFHNRDRSRNQCYLLSVKDAISHLNIPCFAPLLSQQMML